MPDIKPTIRTGRVVPPAPANVAAEPRPAKRQRTSRLFKKYEFDAEAFCEGFERIEAIGLLPEVLRHLEGKDLFSLASTTRFFRDQAVTEISKRVTTCLKRFVSDTKAFAVIMNALDVRIAGFELLHLVLEPSLRVQYDLKLFVKGTNVANCLKRHLQTFEGYELKTQGKTHTITSDFRCPNVSDNLYRNGIATCRETWEHAMRTHCIHIKVLTTENSNLNWVLQQGHYHTSSVYQMTANSFTVFYPELTFQRKTRALSVPVVPEKSRLEHAQMAFGVELLTDGPNDGKVPPYFSYLNTQKPLSMPLRLA